jgi:uncharacterized protein YxjI
MRQGQFQVYGGYAPKEEFDVINTEDYRLKVTKTWVEATSVWHIQILSQSIFDNKFEMFLSHEQLQAFKDIL